VFNQIVEKKRQKSWHDRNIKSKNLELHNLSLLYDNKFLKNPCKLKIHWLGPFRIPYIKKFGEVMLTQLYGKSMKLLVNGSTLNTFYGPNGV
jgi:hypothetical protein